MGVTRVVRPHIGPQKSLRGSYRFRTDAIPMIATASHSAEHLRGLPGQIRNQARGAHADCWQDIVRAWRTRTDAFGDLTLCRAVDPSPRSFRLRTFAFFSIPPDTWLVSHCRSRSARNRDSSTS